MSANEQATATGTPPAGERDPTRPANAWLRLRWLAALGLTVGMVYPVGRMMVVWTLAGWPEGRFAALALLLLGLLALVTRGLAAGLPPRSVRGVDRGVLLLWGLVSAIVLWVSASDRFGLWVAGPLFVVATVGWVLLGWAGFDWPRARVRAIRGLLTLPCAVLFPLLSDVHGLTGEARVRFDWRWNTRAERVNQRDRERGLAAARGPAPGQAAATPGGSSDPGGSAAPDRGVATTDTPVAEVRALVDSWQYLGPERTGVVAGPRLSADWRGRPPRELWRQPVGAGWSGFAVVGNRAYTQEQQAGDECVTALRLADGARLWTHRSPARFVSDMGGVGPRGTPTVTAGELYAVGGTGLLTRLDVATGEPAWSVDLLKDNQGEAISHGVCGSPLVWNDWVIASPTGCEQGHLAAYDRVTGQRMWRGGGDSASYGSPALAAVAGVAQVLQTTSDGCEGVDPQTGETLWSLRWSNGVRVNCSQLVVVDGPAGRLLMTTGYGTGSVLFEVSRKGEGSWQTRELWRAAGAMKTKFTTAVLDGGVVYGLDDGILACLDLETGKTRWKRGRYGHGHVLRSGDLLVVQAEVPGEVVLVRVSPQGSEELGRLAGLAELTWNVPTLAGRHLLIRNDREAVCYELPLEDESGQQPEERAERSAE